MGTDRGPRRRITVHVNASVADALTKAGRQRGQSLGSFVETILNIAAEGFDPGRRLQPAGVRDGFCPSCGHSEALHAVSPAIVGQFEKPLSCDYEGCGCTITPAQWRAARR